MRGIVFGREVANLIVNSTEGGTARLALSNRTIWQRPLPTSGYFVSVPFFFCAFILPVSSDTDRDIMEDFIEDMYHWSELPEDEMFVGWWTDTDRSSRTYGKLVVQPSLHVETLTDALTVARHLGQRFIWSIAESEAIPVNHS